VAAAGAVAATAIVSTAAVLKGELFTPIGPVECPKPEKTGAPNGVHPPRVWLCKAVFWMIDPEGVKAETAVAEIRTAAVNFMMVVNNRI